MIFNFSSGKIAFSLLLLILLLGGIAKGQDTLGYQLDIANTTDSSVSVSFFFKVERLDVKDDVIPALYPHYRLFIGYGDGTFGLDVISDQQDPGPEQVIKPNPRVTIAGDSLIYKISHTYYARPTEPVFLSLAKIKTSDGKPPPRISSLAINEWNTQAQTGPVDLEKNAISGAMKNLPYSAEEMRFIDTTLQAPTGESEQPVIDTSANLSLSFHLGPVPDNDFIGILQIRGIDSVVQSGMILIHYNLAEFIENQERLVIDTGLIRTWKEEEIQIGSFAEMYSDTSDNPLQPFKDVIRIDFKDLWVNEVRRIILPFFCPSTLIGSLHKPVFFHAVVIDSSKIEDYFDRFRSKPIDLVDTEQDDSAYQEKDQEIYPGFDGKMSGRAQIADPFYNGTSSILGKLPLASSDGTEPLSTKAEVQEAFRDLMNGLGGKIVSDVVTQDYVRRGHDPNSIELEPDCFGTIQKRIEGVVNFENYGFNGVDTVTIRIKVDPALNKNSFELFKVSEGTVSRQEIVNCEDGGKCFEVEIVDIYLPGILELANAAGFFNVEQLVDDELLNTLRAQVQSKFGETISQGHIVFQATTKGVGGSSEDVIVEAAIIFEDAEAIETSDTIRYDALACGGVRPFFRGNLRLGYNYPFAFSGLSPNFDLQDNFLIGAYADFSPRFNARWYFRIEANLNRWGFEAEDNQVTQQNLEIVPSLRYALSDHWSFGLGLSYLVDMDWETENNQSLKFIPKDNLIGGVLDLATSTINRNWGAGLRFNYYPNAVELVEGGTENLGGLQLYFTRKL